MEKLTFSDFVLQSYYIADLVCSCAVFASEIRRRRRRNYEPKIVRSRIFLKLFTVDLQIIQNKLSVFEIQNPKSKI